MTIELLTEFLGWCTVINVGLIIITVFALLFMRGFIIKTHSKMFSLNPDDLPLMYFKYVGNYKIAIIIFNIVPYCALKIMQFS